MKDFSIDIICVRDDFRRKPIPGKKNRRERQTVWLASRRFKKCRESGAMYDIIKGKKQENAGRGDVIMLKKLVLLVFFTVMVLSSTVLAKPSYYPYLDGDRNYINCAAHQGMEYYIVRDSVNIELCSDSECILSADIVNVKATSQEPPFNYLDEPEITKIATVYYRYEYDTEQMYVNTGEYFKDGYGRDSWLPLKYNPSWSEGGRFELAGDIAFYIAFGDGFYRESARFENINN